MCGRFSLIHNAEDVEMAFGIAAVEAFPPRYNIAPTQPVMVITSGMPQPVGSNLPDRHAQLMRWGFLPSWVKDVSDFPLLINARSETAATKASFKNAMRHRRAIIPASGFYEWRRDKQTKQSQAYWVKPKHGGVVGFAALCETYMNADGAEIDTAAFLTAEANTEFMPIHHRMPIMIAQADMARWLDCRQNEPRHVEDLMVAPQQGVFEAIPVSDLVNKVANNGPETQQRAAEKSFDDHKNKRAKSILADDQGSLF